RAPDQQDGLGGEARVHDRHGGIRLGHHLLSSLRLLKTSDEIVAHVSYARRCSHSGRHRGRFAAAQQPGAIRSVLIDDSFLAIGNYAYRKERIKRKVLLDIRGG
ncbi:MAG TPA: hypothetical protein VNY05_38410, partial [Candidatus Acidoferrales bacterium]|nr:hypothetical protein [Candidatus Acidoferrales bacterium]